MLFLLGRHFHFLRHQKLSAFLGQACCFILTAFDVMYILEFFSFYFDENARKSFSKLSSICATSTKNTETLTPSPLSNKMAQYFSFLHSLDITAILLMLDISLHRRTSDTYQPEKYHNSLFYCLSDFSIFVSKMIIDSSGLVITKSGLRANF